MKEAFLGRRCYMSKIYIDVPVVGYETWIISSYIIDKNGKWQHNDNDNHLTNLENSYPYNERNSHIT